MADPWEENLVVEDAPPWEQDLVVDRTQVTPPMTAYERASLDTSQPRPDISGARETEQEKAAQIQAALGAPAAALNAAGRGVRNVLASQAFAGIGQPVLAAQQLGVPASLLQKFGAVTEPEDTGETPIEQGIRSLPIVPRVASQAVFSTAEQIPKLAATAAMPEAAGAIFGITPSGAVDIKQAAIAELLPIVGKWFGAATEAVASKLGVTTDEAGMLVNKLGGAGGAAGILGADQLYEISKLPEDQRKDAYVDAVANTVSMAGLGMMGGREAKVKAPERQGPLATGAVLTLSEGAKPPEAPTIEKKPWQMTKAEWIEFTKSKLEPTNAELRKQGFQGAVPNENAHYNQVKHAIERGDPVPTEVLADYPNLKPPEEPPTEPTTPTAPTPPKPTPAPAAKAETAPAQSDFARYQELVAKFKAAPVAEKFEIQKEIEAIKNRNGGMPPKAEAAPAAAAEVPPDPLSAKLAATSDAAINAKLKEDLAKLGYGKKASEPTTTELDKPAKKEVGKSFQRLIDKMGRGEVSALLGDWNSSDLSEDGTRITSTDKRGGGGTWTQTRGAFFDWLFSDEPLDPKQFHQSPEWTERVRKAREIASGKEAAKPKPTAPAVASSGAKAIPEIKSNPIGAVGDVPVYEGAEARSELTRRYGLPSGVPSKSGYPFGNRDIAFTDEETGKMVAYHRATPKPTAPTPAVSKVDRAQPEADLFPDTKGKAPTLERVRSAIAEEEANYARLYQESQGDGVTGTDPIHDKADLSERKLKRLRELGAKMEAAELEKAKVSKITKPSEPSARDARIKRVADEIYKVAALPEDLAKFPPEQRAAQEEGARRRALQYATKLVTAIETKDIAMLENALHVGNKISRQAFEREAGIRLGNTAASIKAGLREWYGSDAWDSYQNQKTKAGEQRKKAEEEARSKRETDEALKKPYRYAKGGAGIVEDVTAKDMIDDLVKRGYTDIAEGKRGAFKTLSLLNAEGRGYQFRTKHEMEYARKAVELAQGTKPDEQPKGIAQQTRAKWSSATEGPPTTGESAFISLAPLKDLIDWLTPHAKDALRSVREVAHEAQNLTRMTDYRRAVLNWSGKLQRSFGEAAEAQRDITRAVKDPIRRDGITNWIQADGDPNVLAQRRADTEAWRDPATGKPHPQAKRLIAGYDAALALTPEEITVANDVRDTYRDLGRRGQHYDVLNTFKPNYVTQVWNLKKGPRGTGSSRTLRDRFKFSKASTFDTFFDGEQAGYVPKTKDISKLLPVYIHEMNSVIAARQMVEEMSGGVASDGRPLVAARGVGVPVTDPAGNPSATLVMPKAIKGDTKDYRTMPNQPALNDWRWASQDTDGNPVFLKSDLALHPEAYDRIKSVLGRSAIREWYDTRTTATAQIPKMLVKGLDFANSETKRTMLGLLAPFHQVQEGTHAIGHRINPFWNIPKIDLVHDVGQRKAARDGLMLRPDRASAGQFMEGFRTSGLVSKIPGIGAAADWYSHYLFYEYIPGLKYKTYRAMVGRNTKVYARDLAAGRVSAEDISTLSAEQANAAYGHLNYADLGRNPTIQHLGQIFLLAPDFLESRARFAGQAIKGTTGAKVGREQFLALGTLAIAQAATAYTAAKLTGGTWDKTRPFEFTLGRRRYTMRSVPEDISSLLHDARLYAHSRLSPLIGKGALQYASGVDWRGKKVSAGQTTKELALQPVPISIRGFLGIGNSSLTGLEQLAGSVGLKISRYNPDQAKIDAAMKIKDWSDNLAGQLRRLPVSQRYKFLNDQAKKDGLTPGERYKAITELRKRGAFSHPPPKD